MVQNDESMRLKVLGDSGPDISVIGFGAWEISIDESSVATDRAIDTMRAAVEAGMTWIDTAEVYGMGRSEELVARALEDRADILVFTKVWHGVHGALTRDVVRAAAEDSLKRLGRDVLDLYLLLEADPTRAVEDAWEAMAGLAEEGLVRAIGVCNFTTDQVGRCERVRHVDAVPNQFSLIHRAEHEALSAHCARLGTTFIAYGPLALGLLTGTTAFADTSWGRGKTLDKLSAYQRSLFGPDVLRDHLADVERLQIVANGAGLSLAQVALAWVTLHDEFTVAIAGSTSAGNTRANAAAGSLRAGVLRDGGTGCTTDLRVEAGMRHEPELEPTAAARSTLNSTWYEHFDQAIERPTACLWHPAEPLEMDIDRVLRVHRACNSSAPERRRRQQPASARPASGDTLCGGAIQRMFWHEVGTGKMRAIGTYRAELALLLAVARGRYVRRPA